MMFDLLLSVSDKNTLCQSRLASQPHAVMKCYYLLGIIKSSKT